MESRQLAEMCMSTLGLMKHAPEAYARLLGTRGRTPWAFQVADFQLGITEKPRGRAVSAWGEKSHEKSGEKGWWVKFAEIYFSVLLPPNLMNPTVSGTWSVRDRGQADPFALAHKTQWSSRPDSPVGFPLKWKVERSFCGKGSVVDCSKLLIQCSSWSPIGHTLEAADDAELILCDSCQSSYFNIADLRCVVTPCFHAFCCFPPLPCPNSSFPQCLFFSTALYRCLVYASFMW